MKRALTTVDIKSTDDESNRTIAKPLVMSENRVLDEMDKIFPMRDDDSSIISIEKKKLKTKSKKNKNNNDKVFSIVYKNK